MIWQTKDGMMKKNNNKISQHNIKRGASLKRRKKRINDEVNKKVVWIEHIVRAGEKLDMDKLFKSARNTGEVKLIIDRLVSRNVVPKMSKKQEPINGN